MNKRYCLLGVVLLSSQWVMGQFADSLSVAAGITVTAASKPIQPLWIVANQFGTIQNRQADAAIHFKMTNRHDFGADHYITSDSSIRNVSLKYGFDIYNNNKFKSTFFKEVYLKFAYRNLEFRAGRIAETIGEVDPSLSSGSLGVSGNARPIPQIGIKLLQYVDVPLTKGWVQFKGEFSHGWFGEDKFVKNSYLHHKSAYLRFGKSNLRFHAGLNHFAQWGGSYPEGGQLPNRFKDFLRIVTARSGTGGDYMYQQGAGSVDTANGVGNHIVIPDFGLSFRKNGHSFTLYTQNIFDKGRADSANQRDELDALRIFGPDHLVGFKWESEQKKFLQTIAIEWIYTKSQGGSTQFIGRDDYYNNSVYPTGWQYKDRIIGTPLFMRRADAINYGLGVTSTDPRQITSNRISGVHLAFRGYARQKVFYRVLATHVKHFGNYYNDDVFALKKNQNHLLLEAGYWFLGMMKVTACIGHDFGEIYQSTGAKLSIDWKLY